MIKDPHHIAVCCILHYPRWYSGEPRSDTNTDKIRGDLALKTLKKSVREGYTTIAVASNDNEEFSSELHAIPRLIIVNRQSQQRSPAKRQAIRKAADIPDIDVIVLTEPEKYSFVAECIEPSIAPIISSKADIVIPKRNIQLFKETYPDYMYESEIEGNYLFNEELKAHGILPRHHEGFDMFFGPRVLKNVPEIVTLFLKTYSFHIDMPEYKELDFNEEDYSNTQYFPVITAMRQHKKVISVEVPFKYPSIQKANEDDGAREAFIQKRKQQRIGILTELMHFLENIS